MQRSNPICRVLSTDAKSGVLWVEVRHGCAEEESWELKICIARTTAGKTRAETGFNSLARGTRPSLTDERGAEACGPQLSWSELEMSCWWSSRDGFSKTGSPRQQSESGYAKACNGICSSGGGRPASDKAL